MLSAVDVVGTGIAGLATALALQHEGLACQLYGPDAAVAAAPVHDPLLQLPPNGSRVLRRLGLLDAARDLAVQPDSIQLRAHRSGYVLGFTPLGNFAAERHGAPWLALRRSALRSLLQQSCSARGLAINTSTSGRTPATLADHVQVLATGAAPGSSAQLAVWQAEIDLDVVSSRLALGLANAALNQWWGPGLWLQLCRGRDQTLHLTAVSANSQQLDRNSLQGQLAGWHRGLLELLAAAGPGHSSSTPASAAGAPELFHGERLLRVGHACHGLPGSSDQAAALALEDAWACARLLDDHSDAPDFALAEYSRLRRPRRLRVAAAAGRQLREATVSGSMARLLQNTRTSLASRYLPEIAMQQVDWLYSHDVLRQYA